MKSLSNLTSNDWKNIFSQEQHFLHLDWIQTFLYSIQIQEILKKIRLEENLYFGTFNAWFKDFLVYIFFSINWESEHLKFSYFSFFDHTFLKVLGNGLSGSPTKSIKKRNFYANTSYPFSQKIIFQKRKTNFCNCLKEQTTYHVGKIFRTK